jgi:hypothetical protein
MKHYGNEIFVLFQIRNQLEKLANGIHIGTNYRLYAVERVCMSPYIKILQHELLNLRLVRNAGSQNP